MNNNIKMDFREVGWEGLEGIYLTPNRDQWLAAANSVMKLRVP
jgi:hypothetical protein